MSEYITIRDFILTRDENGCLWLSREGGESMQCGEVTEAALETMLEQFWEENL